MVALHLSLKHTARPDISSLQRDQIIPGESFSHPGEQAVGLPQPGPIDRIRVALNSSSPLVTRVVLDLADSVEYEIVPSSTNPADIVLLVKDLPSQVTTISAPARKASV